MGKTLKKLFQTSYFRIVVVPDEETVELCGALKVCISYAFNPSGQPILLTQIQFYFLLITEFKWLWPVS